MRSRLKKKFAFYSLTICLAVFVCVTVAEVTLRLFGIGYGTAPLESDPYLHHVRPRNYSYRVHTPSGEYGGHEVHYNMERIRADPALISDSGDRELVRVLGDSFVESTQVAYEDTFVGMLDQRMSAYQFVNMGVGSYSPVLSLLQLHHTKLETPRLILHLLYRNDPTDDKTYMKLAEIGDDGEILAIPGAGEDPFHHPLLRFLRKSYLFRLVRKGQLQMAWLLSHREPLRSGRIVEHNLPLAEESEKALISIAKLASEHCAKYVLMSVPSEAILHSGNMLQQDKFSSSVQRFARHHEIDYIDLEPVFLAGMTSETNPFLENDIHFSAFGHELVASAVEKYLLSWTMSSCLD